MNKYFNDLIKKYPEQQEILNSIQNAKLDKIPLLLVKLPTEVSSKLFKFFFESWNDEELTKILEIISENRQISASRDVNTLLNLFMNTLEHTLKKSNKDIVKKQLSFIAIIAYYQKDYKTIDQCHSTFLSINKNEINFEFMVILHYQGLALFSKKYYYDAISFYNSSLECAEKLGAQSYKARIYDCLGRAYGEKGRFQEAFQYYALSIEIKKTDKDLEGLAITYGNEGRLHISAGDYKKAKKSFVEDLKISQKTNDIIGQIIMHSQIGEMDWILKDTKDALAHYEKSFSLAQKSENHIGVGFALIGLANCYFDLQDNKKLNNILDEISKNFIGKNNLSVFERLYYKILGKIKESNNDYNNAEKAYLKFFQIDKENILPIEKGLMYERLAVLYSKKKDVDNYKNNLLRAIDCFENTNAYSSMRRIHERLKKADKSEWLVYMFKEFLGRSVVDYITQGNSVVEHVGEKKFVSVLFSDIRGFTSFSEKLDPEDLIETLNNYLSGMTNAIEKHNGEIDKFIGDAIMAVYFTKQSQKQTAVDAVYSAIDMMEELEMFNQVMRDRKKQTLNCGVGIHCGTVISGTMGSNSRKEYTVLGDAVNTASRFEGLTKKYGVRILVTEDVYKFCENDKNLHFRKVDMVTVKGKTIPKGVYQLYKANDLSSKDKNILDTYDKAHKLYLQKQFDKAKLLFVGLLDLDPDSQKLYNLYIERCSNFIKNPPPKDWDGVVHMTQK